MQIIKWLEDWYADVCDNCWEHMYGITIDTLDNPGWRVRIDLCETRYRNMKMTEIEHDNGDNDWLICSIKDGIFQAAGDVSKLSKIICIFKECVEAHVDIE